MKFKVSIIDGIKKLRTFKYSELTFLLIIVSSFILLSTLLPLYDNLNGFHNILLDDYNLTWYDGRSPLNFYLTINIIRNGSIFFPRGYLIDGNPIENYYDFVEAKNGYYFPMYSFFTNYIFAAIIHLTQFSTSLQIFKAMIFLNILFYAISLIIFYFIQRNLGLNIKFSLISTFIAGVGTSILIYSRYLFIKDTWLTLIFLIFIYMLLKIWKKKSSLKTDILVCIIFSIYLMFTWCEYVSLIFFIVFSIFLIKYKLVSSKKSILVMLFLVLLITIGETTFFIVISNKVPSIMGNFLFTVYPKFIPALDFIIYGYHDPSSVWKLERYYSYIFYTFEQSKGNAIFFRLYGLFGSLFGPKGIIFNSMYLMFSILGIFLYKKGKKKNLIILSIVLIIILFGLLHPMWYGGVTPRYNRFFNIPVLFLTFFSFYYIQEISKEKNNTKKYLVYSIFTILLILSILNVSSLAVRADWTYEHESNLVSYDLVLWPWYPPKPQENIINLYLTELGESVEWKFGGEIGECKSYGELGGIVTPLCNCEFVTYAEKNVEVPWERVRVNVTACSRNGDGVIGKFYFDKIEKEIFIETDSCKTESILVENSKGKHSIVLKPKKYGECIDEIVIWKIITIKEV